MARQTTLREKQTLEIIQARMLAGLFSGKVRDGLALKGGLAMRVLAKSTRYTDDIDLVADPRLMSPENVKARINKVVRDLERAGLVTVAPDTKKDTDTTIRWMLNGKVGGTDYQLKIEVSRRNEIDPERISRTEYTSPSGVKCMVDCIDLESLAVAKLDCLSNPKREAPRDVYDLMVLIELDVKPAPELLASLGQEKIERLKTDLWAKIDKMTFEEASEKLLPYVSKDKAFDRDRWQEIRMKVGFKIEDWLAQLDEPMVLMNSGASNAP